LRNDLFQHSTFQARRQFAPVRAIPTWMMPRAIDKDDASTK
jgi:hypothetical protein